MLHKILKLVFGNLIVLLILLGILEASLRYRGHQSYLSWDKAIAIQVIPGNSYCETDSLLGYKHKAGQFKVILDDTYSFQTTHDSLGLRITQPTETDTIEGQAEVWIFGCSFTHGWAINDEDTFPWILQSKFPNYTFINWGCSGYGTLHFYLQLKQALESRKRPQLVIINHADFHFERNILSQQRRRNMHRWNFLGMLEFPFARLDQKKQLTLQHTSISYRPWWLSNYSALAFLLNRRYDYFLTKNLEVEAITITELLLDKIVEDCKAHQIPILLNNIWESSDFIKQYAEAQAIPYLNIAADLNRAENTNMPYDPHPSALANQHYADKMYPLLKALLSENVSDD